MKYLVLVGRRFINSTVNEETGEEIPAHNEDVFAKIPLVDIIKVEKNWDGITVITIDGKKSVYDNVDEMYFN